MDGLKELISNQIFMSAAIGWLVAQILKAFIDMWYSKGFSIERLYGNGGMPSSHSSTVCALASSCAMRCGLSSTEFAISAILAIVVMCDAMGVRRETGKQARLLNIIMQQDYWKVDNPEMFEEKLKELVGHTPLQVLVGAILGIVIACIVNNFYR